MKVAVEELREALDSAYNRLMGVYKETSVLAAVRELRSKSLVEIEAWTLLCALLDHQVDVINWLNPMLKGLAIHLTNKGLGLISAYKADLLSKILREFKWVGRSKGGFKHRFVKIHDILALTSSIARIIEEYGSIGSFVEEVYQEAVDENHPEPLGKVIKALALKLREYGDLPRGFVPDPRHGSAMKRLCLYLRWMTRPYPDLNIWGFIDKSKLLVSLDSGVARVINRLLGESVVSGTPSWRDVVNVTRLLRKINPKDPAKYDYVLSRPAIMKYCTKNPDKRRCYLCPLARACQNASLEVPIKTPSPGERELISDFPAQYSERLGIDWHCLEYKLGKRKADLVFHVSTCEWWVVEAEVELNYQAIGQAVVYRSLFKNRKGKEPLGYRAPWLRR